MPRLVLGRLFWVLATAALLPAQGLRSTAVPALDVFRKQWEQFTREGIAGRVQRGASVRLRGHAGADIRMVIGIFSTLSAKDAPYRDVIRSTWMKQPGICSIESLNTSRSDCRIFATFVVAGKMDGVRPEVPKEERDLTVLDITENMECGKSRAWFRYAAEAYKAAPATRVTHIGKMDMDAFVDVRMLMTALHDFGGSDCPNVYGGRSWWCNKRGACPPKSCGDPVGDDFFKYNSTSEPCWTYMQGGFYFMSVPLASAVAAPGGDWDRMSHPCVPELPEDAKTGKAIYMWATAGTRKCVSALNLKGMETVWHPDGYKQSWNQTGFWVPPYILPQ
mmetsp:Transcript_81539/g.216398  ORF Transcript_81539/g.216398 Transcript_81539/m.216398 type:complete len:334 (-) Transcript_81539:17-1018(-)